MAGPGRAGAGVSRPAGPSERAAAGPPGAYCDGRRREAGEEEDGDEERRQRLASRLRTVVLIWQGKVSALKKSMLVGAERTEQRELR